ncbi:AmmeMemoRadiSam system radical SAM enzyme [Acidipropionibacterium jensenii]|uniref:AmmeMemoRadiSam system radical SAM enzyme n=1 Tax=Acidipropionibacterium jensenii TaxID=1749 RepID=UPI00214CE51F|nr:AmmeMemoRadiSam system radical SAM enzyme [Acidipropionibacterium jensenii]
MVAPDSPLGGDPAHWWHATDDGRVQCDLCPRQCRLREGQRGFCFVRARRGDRLVLETYGRSSGFCLDPVEKKPLAHFHPGTSVLSFGTAGCNLACKYCQNWEISTSRQWDTLASQASPERIAEVARQRDARSVAFTYNDPVIFAEYAIDTAWACRQAGVAPIAVSAGCIGEAARQAFFAPMAAANIDLKGFTEEFYRKVTGARLDVVLDTLRYLVHETDVWTEITTLVIPGLNDSDQQLGRLSEWVATELGPDVPLHFSAFHPDNRMRDISPTPASTLRRARRLAKETGLHHVYLGNVHDPEGDTTWCPGCGAALIVRDWYRILDQRLTADGRCPDCGSPIPGRWDQHPGDFGRRRIPVRI